MAAVGNPHLYNLIYKQVVADVHAAGSAKTLLPPDMSTFPPTINSLHNNSIYNPQQGPMRTPSPSPILPPVQLPEKLLPSLSVAAAASQMEEYKRWLTEKRISCMQGQLPR